MLDVLGNSNEFKSQGEKLAKKIQGKTPVIYASDAMGPIAYRWKTQFNENSKSPAFSHVFAEMNHNEIVGYQNSTKEKFISIFLKDKEYNERVNFRMNITKEIISGKVEVEEIFSKGNSLLARIFSLIYYGDFVSYYHAIQNKIDPSPVTVIENLKKKLK